MHQAEDRKRMEARKNGELEKPQVIRCLTIAGSDSGGGAGIQADLKTFSALQTHGMSVVTAITAQNTVTVAAVQLVETTIIEKQIEAVLDDIGVDCIKIGMLGSAEIVRSVAKVRFEQVFLPTSLLSDT